MRYCLICKKCYDDEVAFCEDDGSQTASIMSGPRVLDGKYEIRRLLGQGGMGSVFEAIQRGIERQVAVKLINPSFVANEQALERFKREALACGRVKHPNAITVYDFGVTEAGIAYLAMEFLHGRSLRDELMKVRVMTPKQASEILAPVCAAVESAHRQDIIHRDLKPDNIYLEDLGDGTRTPKVLDFGIAKLKVNNPGSPDLTGEGSSIGTPAYMSPEQAKGLHLDARSDVYALGVIAYEMLSGSLPFHSTSPMGYLVQHMMEAPISLSAANPKVTPQLEAEVMRALDKSPNNRPQSALEFGRALARAVEAVSSDKQPSAPSAFNETIAMMRRTATTALAGSATSLSVRLLGWPVGIVSGVSARKAASAFAELARELVAAAAQRVPYDVVFEGARRWAERRVSPSGLAPPKVLPPPSSAPLKTAGLALYCAQAGLSWVIRVPSGSELPLLLWPDGETEPTVETINGIAPYYVQDLMGGQVVTLVARFGGVQVWSDDVALVDGGTTMILCVPEPDRTATQNPEMFAHLFGTMEVSSSEGGAEVFLDNGAVPWCVTAEGAPALLYCVAPGKHRITVRKEYFVPVAGDVDVQPGARAVFRAQMVRAETRLQLASNVAGVTVEIVGPEPAQDSRQITLAEVWRSHSATVPAGVYLVRARYPGHAEWMAQVVATPDTEQRVEVVLQPVACPLCGAAAGTETFTCPSCRRENLHSFHKYGKEVCISCAALAEFHRAQATKTVEGWRGYLDAFRSADPMLTRQAEGEMRRLMDQARGREISERAERFAQLAKRGALADVIASWQRVTVERPGDAEGHFALAMAVEAMGDRYAALASYRTAIERSPNDPFLRRELGRLLSVLRMPAEAVREYTAAVQLKPDFADAHFELANLLAQMGQLDAALTGLRAATASQPGNALFHEVYGRALAERTRFREASEAFQLAARCYRRDGNAQRAALADQWARNAASQTALAKAGKFIKDLFE